MGNSRRYWPHIRDFLQAHEVPAPNIPNAPRDGVWRELLIILAPAWLKGAPPDTADATSPLADVLGRVLRRMQALFTQHSTLHKRAEHADIQMALVAPPGGMRYLQQSQLRLPLLQTLHALEEAEFRDFFDNNGFFPIAPTAPDALWFVVRQVSDWRKPRAVVPVAPSHAGGWTEAALWYERIEQQVPYFVDITFSGAPSAVLADARHASLLSGRLQRDETGVWVAEWLRPARLPLTPALYTAFLSGLARDWYTWKTAHSWSHRLKQFWLHRSGLG
ncbi:MAG: hypothetical protein D6802_12320 [Ardenticatenia bacterium]|nr:MAG: hypothetical protein D6802_12320 [Ardenticatenia bacterium]